MLRIFTVGFTKKTKFQTKKSAYAQSAQVRAIRKKMVDLITSTVQKCDLREFVAKHLYVGVALDAAIFLLQHLPAVPRRAPLTGVCCHRLCHLHVTFWLLFVRWLRSLPETFKTDIENACKSIFPLQNVSVRKVKMLKSPKFDRTFTVHSNFTPGARGAPLLL